MLSLIVARVHDLLWELASSAFREDVTRPNLQPTADKSRKINSTAYSVSGTHALCCHSNPDWFGPLDGSWWTRLTLRCKFSIKSPPLLVTPSKFTISKHLLSSILVHEKAGRLRTASSRSCSCLYEK